MSVTVAQLQAFVGTKETGDFIDNCLSSGTLLVQNFIGTSSVPTSVYDQAVLLCASELFHRRSAPQGISQFAATDGTPMRVNKDPMSSAYPLLQPFTGIGI